jgi:hypothetical protein
LSALWSTSNFFDYASHVLWITLKQWIRHEEKKQESLAYFLSPSNDTLLEVISLCPSAFHMLILWHKLTEHFNLGKLIVAELGFLKTLSDLFKKCKEEVSDSRWSIFNIDSRIVLCEEVTNFVVRGGGGLAYKTGSAGLEGNTDKTNL